MPACSLSCVLKYLQWSAQERHALYLVKVLHLPLEQQVLHLQLVRLVTVAGVDQRPEFILYGVTAI